MEQWERELKEYNLRKALAVEVDFEKSLEDAIYKAEFDTEERKKLAKEHKAMPDGSYPIRNASDLRNAIQAFGRAKDPDKTKRWIKRRAKELGLEKELPEHWTKEKEENEEKSIVNTLFAAVEAGLISEDVFKKARAGVYKDTSENRKLGRVGRKYGEVSDKNETGYKYKAPKDTTGLLVLKWGPDGMFIGRDKGFYSGTKPELNTRVFETIQKVDKQIVRDVIGNFTGSDFYGGTWGGGGLLYAPEKEIEKIKELSLAKFKKEEESQKQRERKEMIKIAQSIIEGADAWKRKGKLMTNEEARRWSKQYNDMVNEGGEGYVPSPITQEKYDWAVNFLKQSREI